MSVPSTMAAAVTFGHGGPDQLEVRTDWPTPQPGVDGVLVRVTAAGVNNIDIWTREGGYGIADDPDAVTGWKGVPLDFPRIHGLDIAGKVAAVGSVSTIRGSVDGRSSTRSRSTPATTPTRSPAARSTVASPSTTAAPSVSSTT